ncbi:MAG: cytochrome c [Deltaproteobacteria bacterium]|nr:cytochrome c [Deltaproteobacteria bacterium]
MVVCSLLFIYSGVYNFSATEPRTGLARWVFDTTTEQSVSSHAKGITVPPLEDESLVQKGFHHYNETCVKCHGALGVSPSKMAEGLNPKPPDLTERADQWTPAELYWIVKHGIKRSGMPAFGPKHSEEDLWAIVAFVKHQLPTLSPEEYQAMKEAEGGKQ